MKPNCLPHVTPLLCSARSSSSFPDTGQWPGLARPSPDTAHTHSLHKIKFSISVKNTFRIGTEPQLLEDGSSGPSNHQQWSNLSLSLGSGFAGSWELDKWQVFRLSCKNFVLSRLCLVPPVAYFISTHCQIAPSLLTSNIIKQTWFYTFYKYTSI